MKNSDSPATKADIEALMNSIGKLYDANKRWKDEILEETKRHFDVVAEDLRHDVLGANRDEIEVLKDARFSHERRIRRVETHLGLIT